MDWGSIAAIFRNEVRMLLRDRRTIITSVLLPLLLLPILLLSVSVTEKKREQRLHSATYRYAVTGPNTSAFETWLARAAALTNQSQHTFERVSVPDPAAAFARGDLEFLAETAPDPQPPTELQEPPLTPPSSPPKIQLAFRADREESAAGAHRMRERLESVRLQERDRLLEAAGFGIKPAEAARVDTVNVAPKSRVAGLTLGRLLPLLILLFMFTGGAVVATDLIAGEKERGTLETLLTSAARLPEIAAAKLLVIFAVGLTICAIQTLNLLVYVGFSLIPVPAGFAAAVPPHVAGLLLFLFLPIAALVAGMLLLTSGYARTYKEAQFYFLPVFLLGLLPGLAPLLPGIPLRSAIVLVPMANLAVATKEVLVGTFDWPLIGLSWIITLAAAGWTVRATVRLLSQERLVTAAEIDATERQGGLALFERHVLGCFALLWAVLVLVNNYLGAADIRVQITVNLVVLFGGATALLLRRYRLNPLQALALRAPKPMVWPAVILLAPCGMLTGTGLFRLADRFLPVPPEMVRAFSEALLPPDISLLQILFFLAILPGVIEELTFRGLLLHGLHRRLHPAALVVVVGLVFGVFHVALFRVLPTAWLGMVFALVTLLTGSVFPAMLAHLLNNALGLWAARNEWPLGELDLPHYLAGAAGLAVALFVLWRHRTPYPGLRGGRPQSDP